jgi:hypothetical protein
MKTLRFVIELALSILMPLLIQRWDRKRLSPEEDASAWNTASWAAALYAFGPLSMLGWFWVSRPSWSWWRRLGAGVLAAALIVGALFVSLEGFDYLLLPAPASK